MLRVSHRILVSAPRDSVRRYLQDLANLPRYERRAATLEVTDRDPQGVQVAASGRFLGVPWRGQFRLEFTPDGGYLARMTRGPLRSMTSSFHLRPVTGGTVVTHEERYRFPLFVRPLRLLLERALGQVLEGELRVIKEGAELLNRRGQLEAIETV